MVSTTLAYIAMAYVTSSYVTPTTHHVFLHSLSYSEAPSHGVRGLAQPIHNAQAERQGLAVFGEATNATKGTFILTKLCINPGLASEEPPIATMRGPSGQSTSRHTVSPTMTTRPYRIHMGAMYPQLQECGRLSCHKRELLCSLKHRIPSLTPTTSSGNPALGTATSS